MNAGRPLRIVLTGTFDVRNYGDLLFPLIAERRLRAAGMQVIAASPTSRDTGWRDTMPPQAVDGVYARDFDGVLIGGGNIIHARPVTLPDYVSAGVADRAYPALWLGATLAAARCRVPVAWNAPGVPYDLSSAERTAVRAALASASYVSVRDRESADFLGFELVRVVPDTVLELASLWPRAALEPDFRALLARSAPVAQGRFVAVHVKERSLDEPREQLAARLRDFCTLTGRVPILIGIGQCHGDDRVATALAGDLAAIGCACIDLGTPLGLREIAAAIACSDAYIGASMHGYVSAASYGIPGVIVGKPRLPKMQGLLAHLNRPGDEAESWPAALAQMVGRIGGGGAGLPASVPAALDDHWRAIATAFSTRPLPARVQTRMAELVQAA